MSDYEALLNRVYETPEDWELISVLADYCEEKGDPEEGRYWRWISRNHKAPFMSSEGLSEWYDGGRDDISFHFESDLPRSLFTLILGRESKCKEYADVESAHRALLEAWRKWNPPRQLMLTIELDSDEESPNEYGGWKLVSFSRKHRSFRHPDEFGGMGRMPDIGLRNKLKWGTAFWLDYYEHGNCRWSLHSNSPFCFDTASKGGLLLWEGNIKDLPKGREEREKLADNFLEVYTDWCNGNCYWYAIEGPDGEDIDFCGGFIGWDHLESHLKEIIKPGDQVILNTPTLGEIDVPWDTVDEFDLSLVK